MRKRDSVDFQELHYICVRGGHRIVVARHRKLKVSATSLSPLSTKFSRNRTFYPEVVARETQTYWDLTIKFSVYYKASNLTVTKR